MKAKEGPLWICIPSMVTIVTWLTSHREHIILHPCDTGFVLNVSQFEIGGKISATETCFNTNGSFGIPFIWTDDVPSDVLASGICATLNEIDLQTSAHQSDVLQPVSGPVIAALHLSPASLTRPRLWKACARASKWLFSPCYYIFFKCSLFCGCILHSRINLS